MAKPPDLISGSYKLDPKAAGAMLNLSDYGFTAGSQVILTLKGDMSFTSNPSNDVDQNGYLFYNGVGVTWGSPITLDHGLVVEIRTYDGPNWPDPILYDNNSDPDGDYRVEFTSAALIRLNADFNGDGKINGAERFEGTREQLIAKLAQTQSLLDDVQLARAELTDAMEGYSDGVYSRVAEFALTEAENLGNLLIDIETGGILPKRFTKDPERLSTLREDVINAVRDIDGFVAEVHDFFNAITGEDDFADKMLATIGFSVKVAGDLFDILPHLGAVGSAMEIFDEVRDFRGDLGDFKGLLRAADKQDDKYELQQGRLEGTIQLVNDTLMGANLSEGWAVT
jgi:hypothetical protein